MRQTRQRKTDASKTPFAGMTQAGSTGVLSARSCWRAPRLRQALCNGLMADVKGARSFEPRAASTSAADQTGHVTRAIAFSCVTSVWGQLPKPHSEQIWSALPQVAGIDFSREDFSVGPTADLRRISQLLRFNDQVRQRLALQRAERSLPEDDLRHRETKPPTIRSMRGSSTAGGVVPPSRPR